MWISFFMVSLAIALGFGVGAVMLETNADRLRLLGHRPGRALHSTARHLRASARL